MGVRGWSGWAWRWDSRGVIRTQWALTLDLITAGVMDRTKLHPGKKLARRTSLSSLIGRLAAHVLHQMKLFKVIFPVNNVWTGAPT